MSITTGGTSSTFPDALGVFYGIQTTMALVSKSATASGVEGFDRGNSFNVAKLPSEN